MEQFPRNFRDNLRVTIRSLLIAAVVVAGVIVVVVLAYAAFDLGTVLPNRRP